MKERNVKLILLKILTGVMLLATDALIVYFLIQCFQYKINAQYVIYVIAYCLMFFIALAESVVCFKRAFKDSLLNPLVFEDDHSVNKVGLIMDLALLAVGIALLTLGLVFYFRRLTDVTIMSAMVFIAIGTWMIVQNSYYLGIIWAYHHKKYKIKDLIK